MSTTTPDDHPRLAPHVVETLGRLRARIRRYIWLEGLATAATWLGAAFWLSLAIDWFFEPTPGPRAALLGIAGVVLLAIVVHLIVRRLLVPLGDPSMATVLERRFPQLGDALLTAVFLAQRRPFGAPLGEAMLERTCRAAAERVAGLRLGAVFNYGPLRRGMAAAVLLAASIGAFGYLNPEAMGIWARRSLLLSEELWPRKTHLIIEGFDDGVRKVARGADLEILVKARGDSLVIPQKVEIRYRTEGGARGRETMTREGEAPAGADQAYTYKFESVLAAMRFDVLGGDDRLRDLRVVVVDNPTITAAIECEYPKYMNRARRRFDVAGVMQLPLGTRVTVHARANKPLERVDVAALGPDEQSPPAPIDDLALADDGRQFRFRIPPLAVDTTLAITLFDTDGIRSREPIRLALACVGDEPPQLAVRLDGIGTAITPQARLPFAGAITDDYGIDRVWVESVIDQGDPRQTPLAAPAQAPTNFELSDHAIEVADLGVTAGQKLVVGLKAADRYDLGASGANVGAGERWLLDVVTPEQLRTMLESRELVLRQRFEVILQEVAETREIVERIDFSAPSAGDASPGAPPATRPAGAAPETAFLSHQEVFLQDERNPTAAPAPDGPTAPGEPAAAPSEAAAPASQSAAESATEAPTESLPEPSPERQLEMRRLRVERASQNSRKNAQETAGVADSFDDIRKQLVNNRIDTAELIRRIDEGIAAPLHHVADEMFPELERRLDRLESSVADPEDGPRRRGEALAQLDAILAAMEEVKARMLELESFNEAVEMLRLIIKLQQDLDQKTKDELKQRLRQLMED